MQARQGIEMVFAKAHQCIGIVCTALGARLSKYTEVVEQ